jgi:hypothetical protein
VQARGKRSSSYLLLGKPSGIILPIDITDLT